MALTPAILMGGLAVLALPFAVIVLNRWKRHSGWIVLALGAMLLIVGNIAEKNKDWLIATLLA